MNIDITHVLESSLALAIGGAVLKAMDKLCKRCCSEKIQVIPQVAEGEEEMTHAPSHDTDTTIILPHYDAPETPWANKMSRKYIST